MLDADFHLPIKGYYVYALDIDAGENLLSLSGSNCQIGRLDVASIESIREFKIALGDQKVNILLNVAGRANPIPGKDIILPLQATGC